MSRSPARADELMRDAAEAFAKQRLQKAATLYGKAADSYRQEAVLRPDRIALAHYTRALLFIQGDASGDTGAELDAGDEVTRDASFPGALRFAGLFEFLRAAWRRHHDEFEDATQLLDRAEVKLREAGRPQDLFELFRERVRLAADLRDEVDAERFAKDALDRAATAREVVVLKVQMADTYETWGKAQEALNWLESAAARAFDSELKPEKTDLEIRVRQFRDRHPELA